MSEGPKTKPVEHIPGMHCPKCGSWKKKEENGRKKHVQEFELTIALRTWEGPGVKFPVALVCCADCGAVIGGQIVDLSNQTTPGGIVIP